MDSVHTALFVLMVVVRLGVYSYRVEYVEDSCKARKKVEYELGSQGSTTSVIIRATRNVQYTSGMDCIIKVTSKNYVLLSVLELDFDRPETCRNYLKLTNELENCTLCALQSSEDTIFFDKESIVFYYHTVTSSPFRSGFEVIATAYSNGTCSGNFDFLCTNLNCISSILTCDGYDNCGDNSDESTDPPSRCGLSVGAITGIVITSLLLISILCTGICMHIKQRTSRGKCFRSIPKRRYTGPASSSYQRLVSGSASSKYGASSINQ